MKPEANTPVKPPQSVLQFIRDNYALNKNTGEIFSWKKYDLIGTKSNGCSIHDGYVRIRTNGLTLKYHHVVFFLHHGRWPESQVDHKDGDKYNNHPLNLEETTNAENQRRRNEKMKARGAA